MIKKYKITFNTIDGKSYVIIDENELNLDKDYIQFAIGKDNSKNVPIVIDEKTTIMGSHVVSFTIEDID